MVTEEERKNFLTLRRVLLANSVREYEWSQSDTREAIDPDEVIDTEIRTWKGYNDMQIIDIPDECVKSLKSWYNREILPKFDKAQESLYNQIPEEPGFEDHKMVFNCISKQISSEIIVSYTAEADEIGDSWDRTDNLTQMCENFLKKHPECDELRIDYYGGGDSGDIDFAACDGETISVGELSREIEDFVYRNLPGGWEINEGSRGSFIFDLNKKQASLSHIEYYEATEDILIQSDKF